jgi:outer membrane protein OmpA-like peptidoglycan-associated protein
MPLENAASAHTAREESVSRPVTRIVKLVSKYRYGLLAATLLSTPALPYWNAASEARNASDGTIVLAQREEPKKKDQPQKGQPRGKQPPQHNAQPQHKQAPKQPPQQRAQPQQKQAPKQPPQQRAQPQHKEAPRQAPQRNAQPEHREAPRQPPQQRRAQPQQKEAPKQAPQQRNAQPQRREVPKQPPQQRSVQPQQKEAPKQQPQQRSVQPQQPPQQRGAQPQQPPQQRSVQPQQRQAPNQPQQQQNAQPQQRRAPNQPPQQQQQNAQPQFNRGPQNAQQNRGLPQGVRNIEQLRSLRQRRTEPGGRVVIVEPDNRHIVREHGHTFVRYDDRDRFRRYGNTHQERRNGETYTIVRRPDGTEIITITNADGRLLRRIRRDRDRREVVLIDNRPRGGPGFFLNLAPPRITIPRNRYIVDVQDAPPALIYQTLEAPPVEPVDRAYSLDEVRYNVELRDRMRRVDIDTIHFETGSWEVASDQYPALQEIANAILRVIEQNPRAVVMIEGYTDAVGQEVDNLSLSDRRAETVAEILTANFNVPPENLVTQGYGEQFLKIPTQGPSRENRRVTVRNITPLLRGASR